MKLSDFFKVVLFMVGGGFLLSYACRGLSFQDLVVGLRQAQFQWLGLATVIHWGNHLLRSYRWRLLVGECGVWPSLKNTFLAEMAGFFVNVPFPRVGEWTRCQALKKLEGVPMSCSLGGVVVERTIDIVAFLCITLLSLLLGGRHTWEVIAPLLGGVSAFVQSKVMGFLVGVLVVVALLLLMISRRSEGAWEGRAVTFLSSTWGGIRTAFKAATWRVGVCSLLIWGSYFMVEYLSFFSIRELASLGMREGLYVFLATNLGMVIPVPSGLGTYHLLVTGVLVKLGVPLGAAFTYATLTHGIHLFNALVVGGVCSFLVLGAPKAKKQEKGVVLPSE